MISMSVSPPRIRLATSMRWKQALTPTLMFGATSTGMSAAHASTRARSSGENPVVPMTIWVPAARQRSARATVADGKLKSMTPSTAPRNRPGSSVTSTPLAPEPARVPASEPSASWAGCSSAPPHSNSGCSAQAATRVRPIRPAAPEIASRITSLVMSACPRRTA